MKQSELASAMLMALFAVGLLSIFVGINITSRPEPDNDEIDPIATYVSPYQENISNLTNQAFAAGDTGNQTDTAPPQKQGELEVDPQRKIVKFKEELSTADINELSEKYNIEFSAEADTGGIYTVYGDDAAVADLTTEPIAGNSEIDQPIKLLSETQDWGVSRVGAEVAWSNHAATGDGVVVAVIDTGVDLNHEDLAANMSSGYNFISNNNNPDDDHGHGTHVAGTVAAVDNNIGSIGVAYDSTIMPLKVLNSFGYGYMSDIARAIYYAADNGADVINLSLGASYDSVSVREAVAYAATKDVVIVAAAGNQASSDCIYPARYTEVICVGATDQDNKLASFSNLQAEIVAPGVSIYSTYHVDRYTYLSGTSMATPHVAGVASLIRSYCPTCSAVETREFIRDSAIDLGVPGYDGIFGYGLVDAYGAINTQINDGGGGEAPTPVISGTYTPRDIDFRYPASAPQTTSISTSGGEVTTTEDRISIAAISDVDIQLKLSPMQVNSTFRNFELYKDGSLVTQSSIPQISYLLDGDTLSNNQYVIQAIATYEDGSTTEQTTILDFTAAPAAESNDLANPQTPTNQRVLGITSARGY